MAVLFSPFSWWLSSRKQEQSKIPNGSSLNSSSSEIASSSKRNVSSSSRNKKRKCRSREERKIDREYDIVLVPPDGGCILGSDSDDSDWSIGWLEPHGPGFQSNDDFDDSFAVLVRCYGQGRDDFGEDPKSKLLGVIRKIDQIYSAADGNNYMEQWLSSLQNN